MLSDLRAAIQTGGRVMSTAGARRWRGGIVLFLAAVAIGTGAIAARRAARTDPTTALRHD